MKKYSTLFLTCVLFTACNIVVTKSQYLQSFDDFINNVKTHYQTYGTSDWQARDAEFTKLNVDDYAKFENELTGSEKAKVLRYSFVYNLVRGNITLVDLLRGKYNSVISNYSGELMEALKQATLLKKDMKDVVSIDLINKIIFGNGDGSN